MARKPRLHYPGAVYHVMLRGNGGQDVFFTHDDRHHLYRLLAEGIERYGHRIHAFCCMTNHVHLAIQVADISLSRIMQHLAGRYSQWVNTQQGRRGHLFQGRYKALLVDADHYLVALTRYIHLNPVRAGLVDTPAAYPWSSHRAYMGQERLPWLTTDWVLTHFARDVDQARQHYWTFVDAGRAEGHRQDFHRGTLEGRLLGDDTFIDTALRQAGQHPPVTVSLAHITATVCNAYGLHEADLIAAGKSRRAAQARATVAWIVRELPHVTLTQLSQHVHRDITTLSASVHRLLQRAQTDIALAQCLEKIKQDVLAVPR